MPKRTNYTTRRTELSKSLYDTIISEVANHHQFNNFDIRLLLLILNVSKSKRLKILIK